MLRAATHIIGASRRRIGALTRVIGALTLALAPLGACDDVRGNHPANDAERDAARSLVSQLAVLTAQPATASEILAATDALPILTLIAPEGTPVPRPLEPLAAHLGTADNTVADCVIATASSVAFSQCEIGAHAVEGTWSVEGRRVHAEMVDVFAIGPELHGSVAVEARLTRGAELSGELDAGLMWSTDADDYYVLDARIRIDSLAIEGPMCASGGTVTLTGTLGDGPSSTTTLWFGPGCVDVQIAR